MTRTYKDSGVDLGSLDEFAREAQAAARSTEHRASKLGYKVAEWSRGESVFLREYPDRYEGHTIEGLGTKSLVADAMYIAEQMQYFDTDTREPRSYCDNIARCTIAMIVNDMATLGVRPLELAPYVGVGHSDWFLDKKRYRDWIRGMCEACEIARCVWGGGETAVLRDVLSRDVIELCGSSIGDIKPKSRLMDPRMILHGDQIVLMKSSGVHANGFTLFRGIGEALPNKFQTVLPNGTPFGEELLTPTVIYSACIEDCLNVGIPLRYGVHITGHGWRKLMRASKNFVYTIESIPKPQNIFSFIQLHGSVELKEMYGNFNMGAGFAVYVSERDVEKVLEICALHHIDAMWAGYISRANMRRVEIKPQGIVFEASDLAIR